MKFKLIIHFIVLSQTHIFFTAANDATEQSELNRFVNAVRTNNIETARQLIRKEWVNARIQYYWQKEDVHTKFTLLTIVCKLGYVDMVDLLLEHNADPDRLSSYRITSTMAAAQANQPTILRKLLTKNPNILDPCELQNETALDIARRKKHTEIERLLLLHMQSIDTSKKCKTTDKNQDVRQRTPSPQEEESEIPHEDQALPPLPIRSLDLDDIQENTP